MQHGIELGGCRLGLVYAGSGFIFIETADLGCQAVERFQLGQDHGNLVPQAADGGGGGSRHTAGLIVVLVVEADQILAGAGITGKKGCIPLYCVKAVGAGSVQRSPVVEFIAHPGRRIGDGSGAESALPVSRLFV